MTAQSDSIGELAKALCKCQGEMKAAVFNGHNSYYKSDYADLNAVWDACRAALQAAALAVCQTFEPSQSDHCIDVVTTLMHDSGEWISGRLTVPYGTGKDHAVKVDPQGMGIGITYGRRYALAAILGIISDQDTDGEGVASGRTTPASAPSKPRSAPDSGRSRNRAQAASGDIPVPPPCPVCGGDMWDNRDDRAKDKAAGKKGRPAWKCKDSGWDAEAKQPTGCAGMYWASDPNDGKDAKPAQTKSDPRTPVDELLTVIRETMKRDGIQGEDCLDCMGTAITSWLGIETANIPAKELPDTLDEILTPEHIQEMLDRIGEQGFNWNSVLDEIPF